MLIIIKYYDLTTNFKKHIYTDSDNGLHYYLYFYFFDKSLKITENLYNIIKKNESIYIEVSKHSNYVIDLKYNKNNIKEDILFPFLRKVNLTE